MVLGFTTARYPRYDDAFTVLQRSIQRNFDEACAVAAPSAKGFPLSVRLDVQEDEHAFHVALDLPGLSESDIIVTFDEGVLSIRGEKKIERNDSKKTWHVTERSSGSFSRQLSLPGAINADQIEAKFERGVLEIVLPKAPPEPPSAKKINIKAG
ncbi:MAG: Hsp20/alpha crystallin family protein [Pseudomonadota bacterium]|nr:Hsp20/alpha crystallin family protein [Pseudomonadota bacterium]